MLGRTLALFLLPTLSLADTPDVEVTNVRRVFHNGEHNAFTDLTVFKGAFYLAFRSCPDGHGVSPNASVVILTSKDTREWKQVHRFAIPQRDTRDPHFLVFKDRLFVYTGTWFSGDAPIRDSSKLDLNMHLGFASTTADGREWSEPVMLDGTFGHYVWRAAAFGGKAYLCGRRKIGFKIGPRGEPNEVESMMLESDDGLVWRSQAKFQTVDGDETAFLFERDGSVIGIGRRRSTAQLLRSNPPYQKWRRTDLDRHIGGPLLARWGGRLIVGGRRSTQEGPKTSLCWLNGDKLSEIASLPSAGDNSYPGFVAITPTKAVVSWYSSHENSETAIYMADLSIAQDLSRFSKKERTLIGRADEILASQRENGGWSKADQQGELAKLFARHRDDTTLDNGQTHTDIPTLAKAFAATNLPRFRHGVESGLAFLFEAQYENGGWPQRFPHPRGYARHITFNDGAMVGALGILLDVSRGEKPFAWTDYATRERANAAVHRGIDCILRCQIAVDGVRIAWGQQHDETDFQPRPARTFEPASLCSAESVGVVRFLMRLESPSSEVVAAVEAAVAWLSGPAKLTGIRQVRDPEKGKIVIEDADAPPLWARLYEIGTSRPIFGDRDGKTYYQLSEISDERRHGYAWYVDAPRELLEKDYPAWKKRRGS